MQMKKKLKEEKASMAVYVTIVLFSFLLILTGIYLTSTSVRRAQLSTVIKIKQSYEIDSENKDQIYQIQLVKEKNKLPEVTLETPAGTIVRTPDDWTTLEGTAISDGNGTAIPLPAGFYYIGGDYNTGLVISDKEGDTIDASGTTSGNQFVWIPVPGDSDLIRTEFSETTGQATDSLDATYTEPFYYDEVSGYSTEEEEYNVMRMQILRYGGFFIGRYEAGVNSITLRTVATTAQTVVSKKGVAPYTYIPWGTSVSDISEISGQSGAVYLAQNFDAQEGYTSVTSTLCYGCQWDAMCRYIGDSQRKASTKSAVELTGKDVDDVSKNIYDLAGNCTEWTMEAGSSSTRVKRGGYCTLAYAVSYRITRTPTNAGANTSFRLALYVN